MAETIDLQRLLVSMEASHAKMSRELVRANRNARNSARRIESDFNRMNTRVTGALRGAGRVAAQFGLALGGAAIVRQIGRAVSAVAELGDAAEAAGVSAERLQVFRTFVEQNGASVRDADDALKRFNRRLGEFANSGAGPAARAMEQLDVAIEDANGNLRTSEDIFDEVLGKLSEIDDQARVSALSAQLFGDDAGPRLLQALRQGIRGLDETEERMRRLGIVMSNEMVEKAKDLNDQFAFLGQIIRTRFQQAVLNAIDVSEDGGRAMEEFAGKLGDFFDLIANNLPLLADLAAALIGFRLAGPVGALIGVLGVELAGLGAVATATAANTRTVADALEDVGIATSDIIGQSPDYIRSRADEVRADYDAVRAAQDLAAARIAALKVQQAEFFLANDPRAALAQTLIDRADADLLAAEDRASQLAAAYQELLRLADEAAARNRAGIGVEFGGGEDGDDGAPAGGITGAAGPTAEQLAARLQALRDTVATELEIEQQAFAERLAELQHFQDQRLIGEEEANALKEDLTEHHLARIKELEREANLERLANVQAYTSAFASIFGSLAEIVGAESERQLRISKAFALAEAAVNTAQGITKALASSAPPVNFIQAAAVAAAGAAQIAAIRRAQPGNASAPSVGGSAGGAAAGGESGAGGPSQTVNVHLRGGPAFSESQVRDLIDQINKSIGNGAKIKVVGQ